MPVGTINLADVKTRLKDVPGLLDAVRSATSGSSSERKAQDRLRDAEHDLSYYRDELVVLLTRGADAEPWPEDAHEHDEKVVYWRRALLLYEQCCDALREMEPHHAVTTTRTTRRDDPTQLRF